MGNDVRVHIRDNAGKKVINEHLEIPEKIKCDNLEFSRWEKNVVQSKGKIRSCSPPEAAVVASQQNHGSAFLEVCVILGLGVSVSSLISNLRHHFFSKKFHSSMGDQIYVNEFLGCLLFILRL